MKSVLGIFLSLTLLNLVASQYQELTSPTRATADMFPYHAVIQSVIGRFCNGALITERFVLSRATCCSNDKLINVYLGFTRNPVIEENRNDPKGQILQVEQVFEHDDYGSHTVSNQKVNNIVLIKLNKNIVPSKTVRPIPIASPDNFPIPPGTFINQTGFLHVEDNDNLRYSTVQEKELDVCDVFYGDSFLRSQERCVKQKDGKRNKWSGPFVVNGVLIGLTRSIQASASCYITSPPCDIDDVYISLETFLLWIYRLSGAIGVNGRRLFERDNPFWKPENLPTAIDKAGQDIHKPEQAKLECPTTPLNIRGPPLINMIRDGINKSADSLTCPRTIKTFIHQD